MFMAMLSSLSSVYNSSATLITIDLYQPYFNADPTDKELLNCGRAATILMTLLTFLWFPVLTGQNGLIFLFCQNIMSHLFPTLVVVFVLGITNTRVTTEGALAGVVVGFIVGVVQLLLSILEHGERCQDSFFHFECLHFNHFAVLLSAVVAVVTLAVSYSSAPPDEAQLEGRTIWSQAKSYDNFEDAPHAEQNQVAPAAIGASSSRTQAAHGDLAPSQHPQQPAAEASSASDAESKGAVSMHGHERMNTLLSVFVVVAMLANLAFWA
jgi:Na+/proline symporter